jgi:hypothetical protein
MADIEDLMEEDEPESEDKSEKDESDDDDYKGAEKRAVCSFAAAAKSGDEAKLWKTWETLKGFLS